MNLQLAIPKQKIVNAESMAADYPDTFKILDRSERESVPIGHFAKVCIGSERFWCRIVMLGEQRYIGQISNDLVCTADHGLKCDDWIMFGPEHIYQITQ